MSTSGLKGLERIKELQNQIKTEAESLKAGLDTQLKSLLESIETIQSVGIANVLNDPEYKDSVKKLLGYIGNAPASAPAKTTGKTKVKGKKRGAKVKIEELEKAILAAVNVPGGLTAIQIMESKELVKVYQDIGKSVGQQASKLAKMVEEKKLVKTGTRRNAVYSLPTPA